MKKTIIASVIAALLSTTALADNVIIENEYVRAGVNETTGTFGSGGNTRPGLQYDSTGTGTFPADGEQGDYLTPGAPFDGFTVNVDGTSYTNNNAAGPATSIIPGNGWTGTPTADSATWSGSVTGIFDITNTYSLPSGQQYIDITTGITAQTDITTLRFGRFIDPDAMPAAGDTSATDNVLGYGTIPSANVVFSEATVSRYALGLYSTDSNVGAGISSGWSTDPDAYATGGDYAIGTGDHTIGLGWIWTGVSAGDILTANYAYIFGPSAFDAASTAIAGGAGGGVDITTGTLVDVGSATDAAESGASGGGSTPETEAPTVVDTTTVTITSTIESVSTTLPVLTASITHHTASDDGAVQTIDREKTTTVTTPMEVTTTSFDRTTTTYSDSSETVTDGESTSTVAIRNDVETAITDPGSFTGRVDQIANAQAMQNISTREINFDGVAIINNSASNGSTRGFAVGGNKDLDNGFTIGAGIGRVTNSTASTDGSADIDTTLLNLNGSKKVEHGTVSVNLTYGMMDLTASRSIGDFANAGTTSGTDTSVGIRFVADGEKVRPVFGYTRGRTTVDGYTETGSIQSARTVAESTDYYGYATIGVQATLAPGVEAQALRHTDGVNVVGLNVNKEWEKDKTFALSVNRSMSDLGNTNSISAGIQIKF